MKTFGEYFKERRSRIGVKQRQFDDFSHGYISNIERGENNPTQRETIKSLAKALQLPESHVDWLWMYSILDYDPMELLTSMTPRTSASTEYSYINEGTNDYSPDVQIQIGDTPAVVQRKLGPPSERYSGPTKTKWIYAEKGIHIVFVDDRVIDVDFK